ncbi:MAG: hypothetical protein AAB473_04280 [Patescibacteria group bacterium]
MIGFLARLFKRGSPTPNTPGDSFVQLSDGRTIPAEKEIRVTIEIEFLTSTIPVGKTANELITTMVEESGIPTTTIRINADAVLGVVHAEVTVGIEENRSVEFTDAMRGRLFQHNGRIREYHISYGSRPNP